MRMSFVSAFCAGETSVLGENAARSGASPWIARPSNVSGDPRCARRSLNHLFREIFVQETPLSALRGTGDGGDSSGLTAPELSDNSTAAPADQPKTPWSRGRRWLIACLGIVVLVVAVFATATLRFIVFPSEDQPRHVDAIVSFNGSNEGTREADAVLLAEKGYAPVLLFSQGSALSDTSCPKVSRVSVVCFVDVTGNTRGEAQWVGHYAQSRHWHSLLLVPGRGQAARARLLTERCFSGQLVVVPAAESRPPLSQVLHEWGGLLDALVIHRGC
jgi:hypothetical protein